VNIIGANGLKGKKRISDESTTVINRYPPNVFTKIERLGRLKADIRFPFDFAPGSLCFQNKISESKKQLFSHLLLPFLWAGCVLSGFPQD